MSDKMQIVLVDDHPSFRAAVASIRAAEPDMEVVGQGASAEEAIQLAQELLPNLILLDLHMPGSGLHAARTLSATCPVPRIVVLTSSDAEEDLLAALRAGAHGYMLKGVAAREMVGGLRAVCAGASYIPPTLRESLLWESRGGGRY